MASRKTLSWGFGFLIAIGIGILLATGIRSGTLFQFDPDELAHAQVSYLLLHRYVPYRQFLMTYTPVFHWVISPVFLLTGYSFGALTAVRWVMVVFFLFKVAISGWIALRIFGKRVAALFLLFFLIDPFTMYTSMQIRPDNLMMFLCVAGLALLVLAMEKRTLRYFFWSGILLATSGVVLLKIIPSLAVICLGVLWYGYMRRSWTPVKVFILGCILPLLIFFVYTSFAGSTADMIQQVIRDSFAINQSVAFPMPIKHFLTAGNPSLYDIYGSAWMRLPYFEQTILVLAAVGLILFIFTGRRTQHTPKSETGMLRWILAGACITQIISLALVHSVFIQYFLPITWLADIFAAVAIVRFFQAFSHWKVFCTVAAIILLPFLILFSYDSAMANIARSHEPVNSWLTWVAPAWQQIPDTASVYPNIPFRPLAYPLIFEYYFHDLPQSITSRLPPLVATLEKNHVQYIMETYEWKALPQDFFGYVTNSFHQIYPGIYVRNE